MKTAALRKSLTSRYIETDLRGDTVDENLPASAGDSGDAASIPWLGAHNAPHASLRAPMAP